MFLERERTPENSSGGDDARQLEIVVACGAGSRSMEEGAVSGGRDVGCGD